MTLNMNYTNKKANYTGRFKSLLVGNLFFIFTFTTVLTSCNYLSVDNYFTDELKLDSVFASKRYIEAYMWQTASMFPNEANLYRSGYTPGPLATDEAFTLATASGYHGLDFVLGSISENNLGTFSDWYSTYYKIIRKCNTILNRIDEAKDMTTIDRFSIIGNTRFTRAYAYCRLLLDWGPPILLGDEVINSNEELSYYDRPRGTYDETVDYICSELEEISDWLPESLPLMEFGRPTKGAACGLIAKLRLLHASPLFNGGNAARTYFGTWKRSVDNEAYVSQNSDEARWALAAAAAKRVMDMGLYRLHTIDANSLTPELPTGVISDPDYYKSWDEGGAAGIDHFHSYADMFTGESVIAANPEYVWARNVTASNLDFSLVFPVSNGGFNTLAITQKVIDAYSMIDGRDIYNSSVEYPYSETGFTTSVNTFSGYRLNADVYNMYVNREMRFYASIGFSECYWPMSSSTQVGNYNQTITYYYDSPNGKTGNETGRMVPVTGYVLKKFIHPSDALQGTNARTMSKAFAMIRYADVLLWYAESLNNLTTSHIVELGGQTYILERDADEIKRAFNQVRHRSGMPGLSDSELADAFKVQELLEQERMIEFVGENQRYYDVRRWGIYEKTENETIIGMNIESPRDGFYRRVVPNTSRIGERMVNKRMVFLPLPLSEVRRLPSLDQNPGWRD
ncbi:RagB/SusD family nutrient uptake outer membrane protein [uncultured Proteiniphilum sp.]|uniref:RagB/SusD family nutrient uptake outer membrane protein n=1 Tax=uncultured Proteiniphilum sp. TaxID=497637 RepID=UPI002605DCD6|nr:RagB/SusD family nutrient uptake outer membrane protein [uncultured Proteiniphilum sp.]